MNDEFVESFVVGTTVYIRTYDDGGDIAYDWTADNGMESDELFDTANEARRDARRILGG